MLICLIWFNFDQMDQNKYMYSSCPNIIKHFVPHKFSQSVLNSPSSPTIIQTKQKPLQNPFKNMKLQCLRNKSQDYILIFKNRTCKEYSPRKKIKYSGFIKQIVNQRDKRETIQDDKKNKKKDQFVLNIQKQLHRKLIKEKSDIEINSKQKQFEIIRPQTIENTNKIRQFQPQIRENKTSNQKNRIRISSKYSSLRQTRASFKSGRQSNTQSAKKSKYSNSDQSEQIKQIFNFKIKGTRAPKQQTVDFFKRLAIDFNYNFAENLVK